MNINNVRGKDNKENNCTVRKNRTREGFLAFAKANRQKNKEFFNAWGNE